jgi:hypothetical protein
MGFLHSPAAMVRQADNATRRKWSQAIVFIMRFRLFRQPGICVFAYSALLASCGESPIVPSAADLWASIAGRHLGNAPSGAPTYLTPRASLSFAPTKLDPAGAI